MTTDANLSRSFATTVDWLYAGLMRAAKAGAAADRERGLGGKLLYGAELDGAGSALVVAANIAGVATLTAAADVATQKQAIRNGVIDFLVTTLDEALRILKNELRKGEAVAVCVGKAPEAIEREMVDRGVVPDLLRSGVLDARGIESFIVAGARQIDPVATGRGEVVLTWSVVGAPVKWLPRLDAIAGECLAGSPENWVAQRWLRLAPRYLGRLAQGVHLLRCQSSMAKRFVERVKEQVASGKIGVPVEIQLSSQGDSKVHRFMPPEGEKADKPLSLADRQ
jgi:urocanate hydratase